MRGEKETLALPTSAFHSKSLPAKELCLALVVSLCLTIISQLLFDLDEVRAPHHSDSDPSFQLLEKLCHVWSHMLKPHTQLSYWRDGTETMLATRLNQGNALGDMIRPQPAAGKTFDRVSQHEWIYSITYLHYCILIIWCYFYILHVFQLLGFMSTVSSVHFFIF